MNTETSGASVTNSYHIVDAKTNEILHTSNTVLSLKDKEQLKSLLANTFWTPIHICVRYQKDPSSLLIIPIDEYVEKKVKRTRVKKVKTTEDTVNNNSKYKEII